MRKPYLTCMISLIALIIFAEAQVGASPFIPINLDIQPQTCPNVLNTKSRGVLPVAILGSADFDVNEIDVSSLVLGGVSPLRSSIRDVSTPFAAPCALCVCTPAGGDGLDDLTLKFNRQDIVAALGLIIDGQQIALTLTGNLLDGTPIQGQDCVMIIKP